LALSLPDQVLFQKLVVITNYDIYIYRYFAVFSFDLAI